MFNSTGWLDHRLSTVFNSTSWLDHRLSTVFNSTGWLDPRLSTVFNSTGWLDPRLSTVFNSTGWLDHRLSVVSLCIGIISLAGTLRLHTFFCWVKSSMSGITFRYSNRHDTTKSVSETPKVWSVAAGMVGNTALVLYGSMCRWGQIVARASASSNIRRTLRFRWGVQIKPQYQ